MQLENEKKMVHAHELTKNQTLVLDALSKTDGPLSAYSLLDKLRSHRLSCTAAGLSRARQAMEFGLVHGWKASTFSWPVRIRTTISMVLIAFAICDSCGQVDEFSDQVVEKRLKGWSKEHAFKLAKTTIEMRGTCSNCVTA